MMTARKLEILGTHPPLKVCQESQHLTLGLRLGDFKKTRQTRISKDGIAVGACELRESGSEPKLKGSLCVWGWHCFQKQSRAGFERGETTYNKFL